MSTSNKRQSTSDAKLTQLWNSITCGELASQKEKALVSIPHNASVTRACEILASNGISSAPIIDKSGVRPRVAGVFDFRDLGACIVKVVSKMAEDAKQKGTASPAERPHLKLKDILTHEAAELASDLSHHDKFYWVTTTAPLIEAVEYFGVGAHRVFVVDESDGDVKGIVSQSDALTFLNDHIESTGLAGTMVRDLEMINTKDKVVRISNQRSLWEGLQMMQRYEISSLCVMDGNKIWGNLSMGDIKYLVQVGRIESLMHSIKEFTQTVRLLKDKENRYQTRAPTFSAPDDATLKSIVERLVKTRAHRLWLHAPSSDILSGLVSLSDVLRSLTPKENQAHWKNQPLISFVPAV